MPGNPSARKNVTRERVAPAEQKRRDMAANKKPTPKKKSPLSKKKISEKEAIKLMESETKARKLKRATEKHQKKNKGGQGGFKSA